ncbi:pentapeptide repeat-containing protein [Methanocaldococcus sp. 16A]
MAEKKIITNEEFIDKFIKCLENGEDFGLSNAIVEGDVSIKDIYEKIKDRELKGCKIDIKNDEDTKTIIISINVNIHIDNVEFYGKFEMLYGGVEVNRKFEKLYIRGILIKVIFNKDITFRAIFKRSANFRGAKFEGRSDFGGTNFKGLANFGDAEFKGDAYFLGAEFENEVIFGRAEFEKAVSFTNTIFEGEAKFWEAEFKGEAYFMKAIFKKKANFIGATFEGTVNFLDVKFKGTVSFIEAIFIYGIFEYTTFEKDANFNNTKNLKLKFNKSTFNNIADFRDICFGLLSFVDCTFKEAGMFKRNNNIEKKKIDNKIKKVNELLEKIKNHIKKYGSFAIFLNVQFLNNHTKIENFPLSKTSFLKTDVREVMLLCEITDEKILSHYLYEKYKNNTNENKDNDIYYEIYKRLKNHLNEFSIIAEYRNIRLSIENNRSYEEASKIYINEMKFREKFTKNKLERYAIEFYGLISDYGESIEKIAYNIFRTLIAFTCIVFIIKYDGNLYRTFEIAYISFIEVLRVYLQLKTEDERLYILEPFIRVTALVLFGVLFIAIRRKLSRK